MTLLCSTNLFFHEDSKSKRSLNAFLGGDEYLSDTDNMDFLERRIKNEIKLIELLNQYGAKFSSHKLLLYSFEPTRKVNI